MSEGGVEAGAHHHELSTMVLTFAVQHVTTYAALVNQNDVLVCSAPCGSSQHERFIKVQVLVAAHL